MRTREVLRVSGTQRSYTLASVTWGGSITSGVPTDIIDGRASAMSGSAEIIPDRNLARAVDEDAFPELRTGVWVTIDAYRDSTLLTSTDFVLTGITFEYDKISLSFSNDALALTNKVRMAPVAKHMPPGWNNSYDRTNPWASNLGNVFPNNSPVLGVYEAFKAAGFDCVPPISPKTMIDIPFQWGVVTNEWNSLSGHTFSAYAYERKNEFPSWVVRDGMTYMSDGTVWAAQDVQNGTRIYECMGSFMVGVDSSATTSVTLFYGARHSVAMHINPNRGGQVIARYQGKTLNYDIPAGSLTGRQTVAFNISQVAKKFWMRVGKWDLEIPFEPTYTTASDGEDWFTGVRCDAQPGGRLAGFQLRTGNFHEPHYLEEGDTPQRVFIDAPLTQWTAECYNRSLRDEAAKDVLDEAAEALCASWWIDENNVARFQDMKSLMEGPTMREYNFDDVISDYEIRERDTNRRDAINVKYSTVGYSRHQRPRIVLFQGRADRMEAGDTTSYTFTPEDGEEWLGADWYLKAIARQGDSTGPYRQPISLFTNSEGSWIVDINPDDPSKKNTQAWTYNGQIFSPWLAVYDVKALAPITLKMTNGPFPVVELDTPIIRGRGRMKFSDVTVKVGAWDSKAPYDHDCTGWVTDRGIAVALGSFILTQLPASKPSLASATIPYSPELTMGKIVRIKAGSASARDRRLLVLGFTHDPDANTSKIEFLELTSNRTNINWSEAELNSRNAGAPTNLYSTIEKNRSGVNWDQVEKNNSNYPFGV